MQAVQAPHDAQEYFENLLMSSCGYMDGGGSLCVESVLGKIQSAANRREKQQEEYEDEQIRKLCTFFAKVKPQNKADSQAEYIISSSELVLPAPIRFSRKLRKACASSLGKE